MGLLGGIIVFFSVTFFCRSNARLRIIQNASRQNIDMVKGQVYLFTGNHYYVYEREKITFEGNPV
jgi:hypothetical protein